MVYNIDSDMWISYILYMLSTTSVSEYDKIVLDVFD